MLFPTAAFATFFVVAFTVSWLLRPHPPLWRGAMIALSLVFGGWTDVRFVIVLLAMAAATWVLGLATHRAMPLGRPTVESRRLVRAAVALDLVALAGFRYYDFFVESFAHALDAFGLHPSPPVLQILVPLGVSFTTLRAISHVVDVGRGEADPLGLPDVLLYLAFFPTLVAGPLARVGELVPQFQRRPDPRRVAATTAFVLIGCGLFKLEVVSSYLATELVDPTFGAPGAHGGLVLLVGVYGFAIQIYADLSGYADIAIGCALLLGIRLPANFAAPYRSLSVREFWRRWHMTLARWLRDYVYVPLGGSHGAARETARNIMVTMLLGGLWHGADWRFVVWGGLHGAYLVGERAASAWWNAQRTPSTPRPLVIVARWLLTFHLVCLAWILFRADSAGSALEIMGRIATASGGVAIGVGALAVLTIAGALASQLVPTHRREPLRARLGALGPAVMPAGRVLTVMVAALLLAAAVNRVTDIGRDGPDTLAAGAAGASAPAASPADPQVEVRTPSPAEPLRLWVGGDSMAQTFGVSLVRMAGATGVVDARLHYEGSSGLTRHDYYNWPQALARDVTDQQSEVVVVVFGVNDAQGITLPDGTPVPRLSDPRWVPEYRRRVVGVMDQLRQDGRLVVWVTQPPMRDPDFDVRIDVINGIYADEAASRPWVALVDAADVLGDEAGGFAELRPTGSGGVEDVRLADGVHLTQVGADRLAAAVLDVIMARSSR
jgi:D-alanyl-lipoteichoic acid acyltransferase DltB (MBOAT superfamily)